MSALASVCTDPQFVFVGEKGAARLRCSKCNGRPAEHAAAVSAQHTPGPWVVQKVDGSRWPIAGPDWPGGGIVAEVNVCRGPDASANARLIASAPELLAALEPFAEAAERWIANAEARGDRYGIKAADWSRARSAIAKARGEAS